MQEIELKFLIPEVRLKSLMRQAKVKSSKLTRMAAHYYDTSEQELAQAGIGLRIRQEGDIWVQTIKAGGDGIAARLEHNIILDNDHVQTMLDTNNLIPDLTVYENTAIAPALAHFKLEKLAKRLTRQYVTDVQRTTRLLTDVDIKDSPIKKNNSEENTSKENSTIEVAYDLGQIIHGNDNSQQQDIHEIEFELVSGELAFLFVTAKIWCKRYKLCLSTVTKAERGGLLVKGQAYSPAVHANLEQLNVDQHSSRPAFVRAAVHNCLLQILPNSSAIAAGSQDNEHVLQLRTGIHRLQVALKAFKKFSDQLNAEWQPILKQTATLLGDYRELAYLATTIESKLRQHGAPSIDWTIDLEQIKVTPMDAVSANDFQITLLELIEFTMSDASAEHQAEKLAIDKLPKILTKKHIKLLKAEQKLADFKYDDVESNSIGPINLEFNKPNGKPLYKMRRKLKDLHYISEFAAPLYAKKDSKRWLKRLTKAQKSLGQYQDHRYYQHSYQQKSLNDSNALYGAGWFAATLKDDRKRLQKRLAYIQDSATFW